jgi:hypothetical protein
MILNAPDGTDFSGWTVPLEVGEFSENASAALKTWTVTVDGSALLCYRLTVKNGNLVLEKIAGLAVIVR